MRRLLLVCGLGLWLVGCAEMPKAEYTKMDTASVRLLDKRFFDVEPSSFARKVNCGRQELMTWTARQGIVQIYLALADQDCVFHEPVDDAEALAKKFKWPRENGIAFEGSNRVTHTGLGAVWGRRFRSAHRECYFFRHAFEAHHFSYHSAPTAFLMGYFCALAAHSMTLPDIDEFVRGITVVDEPALPNPKQSSRRS